MNGDGGQLFLEVVNSLLRDRVLTNRGVVSTKQPVSRCAP